MVFSSGESWSRELRLVTDGTNNFFSSSPLCSLQKKAEAAHRILEGLGPQVELVSVTCGWGQWELGQLWRGSGW